MVKRILIFTICIGLSFVNFGAISVTSPSSAQTVTAAEDFAAAAFQDPWDMNEHTDLGWFIFDVVSGSKSNLTSISFSDGIFSASATNNDPNISVLETGLPGTCQLGKIGINYKIDADKYKIFAVRLKLTGTSGSYEDALLFWSRNTIYNDMARTNPGDFRTYSGWGIYIINIPDQGYTKVGVGGKGYPWSGDIDSLRFDPASEDAGIKIDWIRLVEDDDSLYRNVSWTGSSGTVDIYLDNDKNEGNGTLGVVAKGVSGKSYSLYVGALAPDIKYYVGVKNSSGGSLKYSPGYYKVNDIPTLVFTSPSEEGGNDFADTVLKNAWDMNATSDLDGYSGLSGAPTITAISAENQEGDSLGSISVLKGTSSSTSGVGDPILYPLWFFGGRGAGNFINTDKYRILVLKMGLSGNWDLVGGSVARVYWHVLGEFNSSSVELMHQSADILIRHKSGKVVMNTIIADMKDLTLENSQSNTGWNEWVDGFRVDPHEFSSSKSFYIQEIKLAAFERADQSYTFKWDYTDSIATTSTLSLYRDTNGSGYNGTLIKSGLNPSTTGQYTWNTSNRSEGTYYIYAVYSDGRNSNRTYAPWPIVISHTSDPTAEIELSRSQMDFGSVSGIVTDPQTFLIENGGTGTMDWSVSTNQTWLSATPLGGSGSGVVTVSVDASALARGTYEGTVTVSSENAVNSPRTLAVTLKVYRAGTTEKPFGAFLTPENNANVSSSIAVTGWVLDDIGLESVKIYNGSSYVGEAVFVEGARPDIEQAYSGYPQNYQAGWGYMLLTNFLPNGGNGTYNLNVRATDKDGHQVTLGSRTINVDNANAVKPFGAIDTPAQGGIASGSSYTNIGWALTPLPNKIPENGTTIEVYVNGVKLGTGDYNKYRDDIATFFPGYANSDGAMATFNFDTTAYANGVHSIYWIATDNDGNVDGIGSRFFIVQNTGTNRQSAARSSSAIRFARLPIPDFTGPVEVIKGYAKNVEPQTTNPDDNGFINIEIKELERLELRFVPLEAATGPSTRWSGYHVVGNQLMPLPIGSTLDPEKGIFYWAAGPGFVGHYELLFMDEEENRIKRINIRISPR